MTKSCALVALLGLALPQLTVGQLTVSPALPADSIFTDGDDAKPVQRPHHLHPSQSRSRGGLQRRLRGPAHAAPPQPAHAAPPHHHMLHQHTRTVQQTNSTDFFGDPPSLKVRMMGAIDMMRAKMCATLMEKHADKFKKNFLKCFKFMKKACQPGDDLRMDGDSKEYTTKKGYCRKFFPENGDGLTPEDLEDHDAAESKNMFEKALENMEGKVDSAKKKSGMETLEGKAREAAKKATDAAKKATGQGGDGSGSGADGDADGDADGEGGGGHHGHHGPGDRSGDGDGDGNGNGNADGGGDGDDGSGDGSGDGGADGGADGSGDGSGDDDGDGSGDGDGHGGDSSADNAGATGGNGLVGGPSKYGGTSQGHVNADDDGDYYSDGLEITRAPGKNWTKEEWAKLMKDGHDENTPMSEQGFGGARVDHNDGETGITDWLHEFGKFRNKKSSRDFHEICKRYPENEWCLLHGFSNSAAPRSSPLGFISGLVVLMTVFTAGNLM